MAKSNLIGKRFGKLTVIKIAEERFGKKGRKYHLLLCKCDCGNETVVWPSNLISGATKSCGCQGLWYSKYGQITHGGSHDRLFVVWAGMIQRCSNPNHRAYKNYGGRGITISEEFMDYENFRNWALNNGYDSTAKSHQCTIDRINNDGPYAPWNCRWVNNKTQAQNKRTTRHFEFNGETHTLAEWSDITGISYKTLCDRIYNGWNIEKALTQPIRITAFNSKKEGTLK